MKDEVEVVKRREKVSRKADCNGKMGLRLSKNGILEVVQNGKIRNRVRG